MTFLSNPPETIRISVTGDNATELAGDWWAPGNSATSELFPLLELVFQATTDPLLNAAAISEFLTELIFKSRSPLNHAIKNYSRNAMCDRIHKNVSYRWIWNWILPNGSASFNAINLNNTSMMATSNDGIIALNSTYCTFLTLKQKFLE